LETGSPRPLDTEKPASMSFLGSSALLGVLHVLESLAGFLATLAVTAVFGLSASSDAFFAAWMLPKNIGRGTFMGLTSGFLGVFAGRDDNRARYNQATTVVAWGALLIAAILSATSRAWVPLTIPGAGAEVRETSAHVAGILAWLVAFAAMAEAMRAICYQEGNLWLPAVARVLGGLLTAGSVMLAGRWDNLSLAAWGVTAGALLEAGLVLLGLRWIMNVRVRPCWPTGSTIREMAGLVGASLSGPAALVLAGAGERALASWLPPGSISAVSTAHHIVDTVSYLAFHSFTINSIRLPRVGSGLEARIYERLVVLVSLPVTVVTAALASPLVAVAFGRQGFGAEDVRTLALVLSCYAAAFPIIALGRVRLGQSYSSRAAGTVLRHYVVLSATLLGFEAVLLSMGLGLRSFGLGFGLAQFCGLLSLWWQGNRFVGRPALTRQDWTQLLVVGVSIWFGTLLPSSAMMAWLGASPWANWLALIAGLVGCALSLLAAMSLTGMPEARQLLHLVRERLG